MIFHSLVYLVFLVVVLAIYWSLPRRGQNFFIIVASYVFYGWEHSWFLLPLWASTLIDWLCALGMERWPLRRRVFLLISICFSLALLGTFKYANFALDNLDTVLIGAGANPWHVALRLALPVGISFYTFQSIGYVVDVYRRQIPAERSLLQYALYVTFFPQLVAGPIERASHMLPQYASQRVFDAELWRNALGLMLWGFFKKVVIADNTAIIANKIFALSSPSFPVLWAGVLAFTVQIYADFSAYTDIARGTARLLGFELMRNFWHPYLATSPADFWRRWHISLSTWMRDYLYISLGGSRCNVARNSFNLLATFAISGLWHGASWNFVLWGFYWGFLLLFERMLVALGFGKRIPWVVKVGFTFLLACIGWLMFRERDIAQLIRDLTLSPFGWSRRDWAMGIYFGELVCIYSLPLAIHMLCSGVFPRWNLEFELPARARFVFETAMGVILFMGILTLRSLTTSDFIYFQF
ncbi:MAG TPA: MBOAT family O-acyltransferase [Chthoniobacterales bacterium]|jgi:D-alanyl-lipoteichoic acid acyltransferase DltB (MBOAT superfamily)